MTIDEFDKSKFLHGEKCLGITGDDDLVNVQIIVANTRGLDNKGLSSPVSPNSSQRTSALGRKPYL